MKTIEEKYKSYMGTLGAERFQPEKIESTLKNIFIAGAESENKELTEWHDLKKEKPEYNIPVLVKLKEIPTYPKYIVAVFRPGSDIGDDFEDLFREYTTPNRYVYNDEIVGWRHIHD